MKCIFIIPLTFHMELYASMFVFMPTFKVKQRQKKRSKKYVMADEGMHMTLSVGGKINKKKE